MGTDISHIQGRLCNTMVATTTLFFLLGVFTCVYCNVELIQTESITVKPGDSPTISCKVSYSVTGTSTHWIRQPAGKGLEWIGIMRYDGDIHYADSLKNKFTISRDTSSNTVYLQGKSLQTEDTAVYYCARFSAPSDYWGKGTKVTVGDDLLPSYIYPLHQCGSGDSSGDISLGCIAGGFSPLDALSFKWNDGSGNALSDFHQYPPVMVSGSTMMVSHITVKAADWNSKKSYKCVAHHQANGTETSETLQKPDSSNRGSTTHPTVSIYIPTPEDLNGKSKFFLLCLVTGFYPEKINIMWQVNRGQYEEGITGEPFGTGDKSSVISQFTVSKDDWNKDKIYTCNAQDASQEGNLLPTLRTVSKSKSNSVECPVE